MPCLLPKAEWRGVFTLKKMGALFLSAVISQTSLAHEDFELETRSLEALVSRLDALRAEVEHNTQTMGAYNENLLSSLNSLTEALVSVEAWQEAADTLEQQIQILRINDGLFTQAQIPLLQQQLGILAARHDWATLQSRLEYLTYLVERDHDQIPAETRLAQYKLLTDWTRLLLTRGPRAAEARYVLQLHAIEDAALQLAQAELRNPDIVQDLIYDRSVAELYIALGIMGNFDTRSQLINRVDGPRPTTVRRLQTISSITDAESMYGTATSTMIERAHRAAMNQHLNTIASLATVYGHGEDPKAALASLEQTDPEQAGIIKLFMGDSVLLRQQYELRLGSHIGLSRGSSNTGSAARHYQEAWELLLKAGYSNDQLNDWFACPALLPLHQFSKKLESLSRNCSTDENGNATIQATAVVRNGIPGLRYEQLPDSKLISAAEGVAAEAKFTVGMNGQADRIEIIGANPDVTSTRIRGKQALEALQFRPVLRDGKTVRTEGVTMTIYSLSSG